MKPDYGNWIARPMMRTLWGITAALVLATLLCALLIGRDTAYGVLLVLSLMSLLAALYMTYCRHVLSENGGGLMRRIHSALIDRFPWDGHGTVLDIGCGTGALSIALAQQYPEAHVVGVDLWPPMWDSSAEQCVRNATLEYVRDRCSFVQGDAAALDAPNETFDAVISNFVFHEVRTQKDKFMLVIEALRVLKKGGAFALHDTFGYKNMYGDMDVFVAYLKEQGIADVSYIPNTERNIEMPPAVRFMLRGVGMLYGTK